MDDNAPFRFLQGLFEGSDPDLEVSTGHGPARRVRPARVVEDGRQNAGGDPGSFAKSDRTPDRGFELTDVARPVVFLQDVDASPVKPSAVPSRSRAYRARNDSAKSSTSFPRWRSGGSVRLIALIR